MAPAISEYSICCISYGFVHMLARLAFVSTLDAQGTVLDISGKGPLAAVQMLSQSMPRNEAERSNWRQKARIAAIIGSCPKTKQSFLSGPRFAAMGATSFPCLALGLRHWISFIEVAYGDARRAFPPCVEDALIWSNMFRCVGTFCNYLGYLRGACYALAVEAPPVGRPALRRSMTSIAERQLYTGRQACARHVCHGFCV